jgi:hypothetical protein
MTFTTSMYGKMVRMSEEMVEGIVKRLSEKYGFDEEEAHRYLGERRVTKAVKPKILLPWTGVARAEWCQGIRVTKGLFGQCTNGSVNGEYCGTCGKTEDLCTTSNRAEWLMKKGKVPKRYGNYMLSAGLSREEVEEAAREYGLTIPECEFEVETKSRGRPRKTAATSDTDSDHESTDTEAKPDLYATLLAEVSSESEGEAVASTKVAVEADEAATKLAEKEAAAATKLAEKEAVAATKLAEKEAEKEAVAATKLAEKEAEKEAAVAKELEEAEKEAAKALKLAEKEAAKAAKLAEKEERAAAKAAKLAEKEAAAAAKLAEKEAAAAAKAAKLAEKEERAAAKLVEKEERAAAKAAKLAEKEERAAAKAAKLVEKEERAAAKAAKLAEKEAADKKKEVLEALKKSDRDEMEKLKEERVAEREVRRNANVKKVKPVSDVTDGGSNMATDAKHVAEELKAPDLFGSDSDSANTVRKEPYEHEEVSAKPWYHGDTKYLKDCDNNLYDPETAEHIGMWDSEDEEILDVESDSDSGSESD